MALNADTQKTAANGPVTATSTRNDKGTIGFGGNISSSRFQKRNLTEAKTPVTLFFNTHNGATVGGTQQPGPFQYGRWYNGLALATGTIGTMAAGSYVMRRVTTTLAGVSKTVLKSGASDNTGREQMYHKQNSFRSTKLTVITWTDTAAFTDAYGTALNHDYPTYTVTQSNVTTVGNAAGSNAQANSAGDLAANPTRAIPGRYTYAYGRRNPVSGSYTAKNT